MRRLILILSIAMTSMAAAPATTVTAPKSDGSNVQSADATPAASVAAGAASTVAAPAATEKKICKLLPSSYSHRSDRVCLTAKEWEQVDDDVQSATGY